MVTAAKQIATVNSYMLPHGHRPDATPRVTMPPRFAAQPSQLITTATRPAVAAQGAYGTAAVPASSPVPASARSPPLSPPPTVTSSRDRGAGAWPRGRPNASSRAYPIMAPR